MAYEHKENSGSLFRNDKKTKPTQPDYRGTVNIDGTKLEISAWIKKSKDGSQSFLSLQFKPPYRGNAHRGIEDEEPF